MLARHETEVTRQGSLDKGHETGVMRPGHESGATMQGSRDRYHETGVTRQGSRDSDQTALRDAHTAVITFNSRRTNISYKEVWMSEQKFRTKRSNHKFI